MISRGDCLILLALMFFIIVVPVLLFLGVESRNQRNHRKSLEILSKANVIDNSPPLSDMIEYCKNSSSPVNYKID